VHTVGTGQEATPPTPARVEQSKARAVRFRAAARHAPRPHLESLRLPPQFGAPCWRRRPPAGLPHVARPLDMQAVRVTWAPTAHTARRTGMLWDRRARSCSTRRPRFGARARWRGEFRQHRQRHARAPRVPKARARRIGVVEFRRQLPETRWLAARDAAVSALSSLRACRARRANERVHFYALAAPAGRRGRARLPPHRQAKSVRNSQDFWRAKPVKIALRLAVNGGTSQVLRKGARKGMQTP